MADDTKKRASTSIIKSAPDDVEEYVKTFSSHMVKEVSRYTAKIEDQYGDSFGRIMLNQFLTLYVANVVFRQLSDRPKGVTGDELLRHNIKMFTDCKVDLSESVANGVAAAMMKYSGQPVEYFCSIKPVPEPLSKKLN